MRVAGVLVLAVVASVHGTALHEASERGALAEIQSLVAQGQGVDERLPEPPWSTPLMVAAARRRPAIVRALLETGADPNLRGSDGSSAITLACSSGLVDTVKLLLEYGARCAFWPRGSHGPRQRCARVRQRPAASVDRGD